jgi:hypothetical protein
VSYRKGLEAKEWKLSSYGVARGYMRISVDDTFSTDDAIRLAEEILDFAELQAERAGDDRSVS